MVIPRSSKDTPTKQVLITGGAGFIGANLARHYLDQGCRVVIYDTLGRNGCIDNLAWLRSHRHSDNVSVLVGDIRSPTRALQKEIENSDAVFHMAGQVAVTTSVVDPVFDFQVNAQGTFNVLELVRLSKGKNPVFFYASTNKVYGGMEDVKIVEGPERYSYGDLPLGISEDRFLDFHSPYGCSKGAADQYVRDYSRIYAIPSVVFRQSCIYGYRQFGLEDQGWVAWFIIAALLGKPMTIYGNGKQVRDVLFIDDLVQAYDTAWKQIDKTAGRIYNIGGGPANTISLLDLIAVLKKDVNPTLNPAYGDWRPGDQPVYISDIRKAKAEFGWEPATRWQDGVAQLIKWVKDERTMLERMF